MFPQNSLSWRIRPLKPCGVITKVLSILLQERFLENVCVPRNHGYPRLQTIGEGSADTISVLSGQQQPNANNTIRVSSVLQY